MKLPKLAAILACLAMAPASSLAAQTGAAPTVSVRQTTVDDPGHARIPVAIWSPANPPAGAALPLVSISHGTGGGLSGHVDTARALAEAGFVVVAPTHPGDNFQDQASVGRPEWLSDRARHLSKVIDYMFTRWAGHAALVPNRVGMFGFSAGATTALIGIGGVPDLGRVPAHCARRPELVCRLMAPPAADAPRPVWTRDRRIAAAVLAAPGLGFAFEPASLANVRVPLQLWVGSADQIVPYETNAGLLRASLPPLDFHRVEGAAHLSFLTPCAPDGPPALCQDGPGFDRAAFHRAFNRSLVTFFRDHLGAGRRPRAR
jgi:predicted dienelactone hydrolase